MRATARSVARPGSWNISRATRRRSTDRCCGETAFGSRGRDELLDAVDDCGGTSQQRDLFRVDPRRFDQPRRVEYEQRPIEHEDIRIRPSCDRSP